MATTRIIPLHHGKGKTLAYSIEARTNYAKDPAKTNDGELVSAFECDPNIMHSQFLLAKREYKAITGREQEHDVIAYQVRQSFRPGEITPDVANRIGFEFAATFLKGNHAYIVATHVDKKHIHNHIIWNSTTLDCSQKFRNFWGSAKAVRRLSDQICVENGLSIVENPKGKSVHYGKWRSDNAKSSHREQIRTAIDTAMERHPKDITALLNVLIDYGYEIKYGKVPALRGKEQQRFIRLDTLGRGYTLEDLQAVFDGESNHSPHKEVSRTKQEKPMSLLVDIEAALSAGKGIGYERWAKVFNLKQMAQTMIYLSEHSISDFGALKQKTDDAIARHDTLSQQIKEKENQLSKISALRAHIIQYAKTRDVYVNYRKNGYSKVYYNENEASILLHKASKKAFDDLGLTKMPNARELSCEYEVILAEKKKLYAEYRNSKAEMREILVVSQNVDRLLGKETLSKAEVNLNRPR